MTTTITRVAAWESLDSRGTPTVSAKIWLADGSRGQAMVPSGASTGAAEKVELRDGGERYGGKGVQRAVAAVNTELAAAVSGRDALDQVGLDDMLRAVDGTESLGRLGANAVLAVSLATARAAAASRGLELWQHLAGDEVQLPLPMVNIISGGAHALRSIDVQDLLAVPLTPQSFTEAIEMIWRVRRGTAAVIAEQGFNATLVADEGGLAVDGAGNREALELLLRGIERAELEPGTDIGIAIDVAASELYDPQTGRYHLQKEQRHLDAGELIDEIAAWCRDFPVISIEDLLDQEDWSNWARARTALPGVQLIGDDLFATNAARLNRGIEEHAANAILIKLNQIGTLTAAREAFDIAQANNFATVVSARSGETEDVWLSDVAVGWNAGQIKVGSTMRSERTAKWNRLLELEQLSGVPYVGSSAITPRI